MPGFNLFTSNRMENLSRALAELLQTPLISPLDQEIIIVQSNSMKKWISMELARQMGICANMGFYYPNAFIDNTFQDFFSETSASSPPFDPQIMHWKVMKLLPECIKNPGFEILKNYLGHEGVTIKTCQLSERISDLFDRYILFRPEMIFKWEQGDEDHWQAELWRKLSKGNENSHRAARFRDFLKKVEHVSHNTGNFPERISIFGISALPPFHMQVFASLSKFMQVNLFLLNPCKEFWGDILSDREIKKATRNNDDAHPPPEDLYIEKGNSLLASMGTLGRDFFDLINDFQCTEHRLFEQPVKKNLLSCIQSDILNLIDRPYDSPHGEPDEKGFGHYEYNPNDTSVQIHSCHSPMREAEVLYDNLLLMLDAKNSDLAPRDILVMTPELEQYAPFIQAVFDRPPGDPKRIPFSIADRSMLNQNRLIEVFLLLLDLPGSRFGVLQVLAILESKSVCKNFGLSDNDLKLISKWIRDIRIRWGINPENRKKMGLPESWENTWEAGLKRLLLGYAMPEHDAALFADILPYNDMEGNDASILGNFIELAQTLFSFSKTLGKPRTLVEWTDTLTGLLDRFFQTDFQPGEDPERELQYIRQALCELSDMQDENHAGYDSKVDIHVIKYHLNQCFEKDRGISGFMSGGVTFCSMLPMRSIPFKVICLIGMNSDAYPGQTKPMGFDLMAKMPRPGDRSRRNDDRYLFLETLLSAREILYISYVGQSIRDNSLAPPSVLVSETMDYAEKVFGCSGIDIKHALVTEHRLQAFSPAYFTSGKNDGENNLFSYSNKNLRAAECLLEDKKTPQMFISTGLSAPGDEWKTVDLNDLCSFFTHPAKYLLNRRLNMYLDENHDVINEKEPFELSGLDRYLLGQDLLEKGLSGKDLEDFFISTRSKGILPHGIIGRYIYDKLNRGITLFSAKTGTYVQEPPLEQLFVDITLSDFRLTGRINAIYPGQLIHYRYARVKAKDHLRIWLHHLALNAVNADACPLKSMLAGLFTSRKKQAWTAWEYEPVENSKDILHKLLKIYMDGLVEPLCFFPESSFKFAELVLQKNKPPDEALQAAQKVWMGNDFNRGESKNSYFQLCFDKTDPLDADFEKTAIEIFGEIFKSQKKVE